MGLFDSIFGGGDQTVTQSNEPWAPLHPYILDNLASMQDLVGQREFFPGDTVANLTPDQLRAIEMTRKAATDVGDYTSGLTGVMGTYMDPGFMSPENNPWMGDYVSSAIRPVTERFTEGILPAIRGSARMTGGSDYGSTRQGVAEGIATRGYLDTVGDISSKMYGNLYGTNIGAQQRAMSMSPMIASMMGMPASMVGRAGDILQKQEQAEIGGEREAYEYGRDIETDDLIRMITMAMGSPYGKSSTTQPGQGPFAGLVGTGLMLGGLGWNPLAATAGASVANPINWESGIDWDQYFTQ